MFFHRIQRFVPLFISIALIYPAPSNARGQDKQGQDVQFTDDVVPILTKKCVACHNSKVREGGLDLETHAALMAGGDSGPSIVPSDLEASYLLARVSGKEEPLMPPEENSVGALRLTESELQVLQAWVRLGARNSASRPNPQMHWQALPKSVQPIYALESSPDGQTLVFGRGNKVQVVDQTNASVGGLVDPSVSSSGSSAHLDIVQSVAFSPDNQLIATGGYRTIKLWRRSVPNSLRLAGLPTDPQLLAMASSSERFAYAVGESNLEWVDIPTGQAHRLLTAHSAPIRSIAWNETSDHLLTCDQDGTWIWTNTSVHQLAQVQLGEQAGLVAGFLAPLARQRFIGSTTDHRIFELTLTNSDSIWTGSVRWLEHEPLTTVRAWTASGDFLVAASTDRTVWIFDVSTGATTCRVQVDSVPDQVFVDPEATRLLVTSKNTPAELWNPRTGKLVANLNLDYHLANRAQRVAENVTRQQRHVQLVSAKLPNLKKASEKEAAALQKVQDVRDKAQKQLVEKDQQLESARLAHVQSMNALTAAEAAVQEAMKQLEIKKQQLVSKEKAVADAESKKDSAAQELAKREQALASAADSANRAASAIPAWQAVVNTEQTRLKELQIELTELNQSAAIEDDVTFAAFHPDGSSVVVANQDRRLRSYATNTGVPLDSIAVGRAIVGMRLCKDSELVAWLENGRVHSWDLRPAWHLERTLGNAEQSPMSDRVSALDFSPDGRLLAAGSGPPSRFGDIKVFETNSGEVVLDLGRPHSDSVLGLKFSPGGRSLASVGADRLGRIFDAESGELIRNLEGHQHHVLGVAWSQDGQRLATAGADQAMKIWNVSSGELIRTIGGFPSELSSIRFMGASLQILSAGGDGLVRLHNAETGKQIRTFTGAKEALFALTVSKDRQRVTAGGQAGQLWRWRIADGKILPAARGDKVQ